MNTNELLEWVRFEFPQLPWSDGLFFGTKCIQANYRMSKIFVGVSKSRKIFIELDKKGSKVSQVCSNRKEARSAVIECMRQIDKRLLRDLQTTIFNFNA